MTRCILQVSLFSENSARWLVADQSIMTLGAADAVSFPLLLTLYLPKKKKLSSCTPIATMHKPLQVESFPSIDKKCYKNQFWLQEQVLTALYPACMLCHRHNPKL